MLPVTILAGNQLVSSIVVVGVTMNHGNWLRIGVVMDGAEKGSMVVTACTQNGSPNQSQ